MSSYYYHNGRIILIIAYWNIWLTEFGTKVFIIKYSGSFWFLQNENESKNKENFENKSLKIFFSQSVKEYNNNTRKIKSLVFSFNSLTYVCNTWTLRRQGGELITHLICLNLFLFDIYGHKLSLNKKQNILGFEFEHFLISWYSFI